MTTLKKPTADQAKKRAIAETRASVTGPGTARAAIDPKDRTIRDLQEKVARLDGQLHTLQREKRNLQHNCATYRIKLEQAEIAVSALSRVVTDHNSDLIYQRAQRSMRDEDDHIPF